MSKKIDNEEVAVQLEEIEKLFYYLSKPINYNISNKNDPECIIEFLLEEIMNTRKSSNKIITIAKSFYNNYESEHTKFKELKQKKFKLEDKLTETVSLLETCERSLQTSEEKVEYMTEEIDDLEKALRDTIKDKEKIKKERDQLLKINKEKEISGANHSENEKKSLIYYREENNRKLAEVQNESNKKDQILIEMTQSMKTLENKLLSEKTTIESLRAQVHSLKNDTFMLNKKVADLKAKNSISKERISELERKVEEEKEENQTLSQQLAEVKSCDDIKHHLSFDDFETDDHTLNEYRERRKKRRSEILSDFFIAENSEDLEISKGKNEDINENLVYMISSPNHVYDKTQYLSVWAGECFNCNFLQKIENHLVIENRETEDFKDFYCDQIIDTQECLTFKDSFKLSFIKVRFI